ncbi:uncharacterized protein LOC144444810 isoform X1 [Glandiceps talaboti]
MAAVPNACFAASNTYASIHRQKLLSDPALNEVTPPGSPTRPMSPGASPSKWINSALNYFHFQGRPRSESNPENRGTLPSINNDHHFHDTIEISSQSQDDIITAHSHLVMETSTHKSQSMPSTPHKVIMSGNR